MIRRAKKSSLRREQPEWELQCQIAEYLRLRYPSVRFLSDVKAAVKLTIPQAVRLKKVQAKDFACPDLMIFAPRKGFNGYFMELKAESPWRQDGKFRVCPHLSRQADALEALMAEGYKADFIWNFEMAQKELDDYLNG